MNFDYDFWVRKLKELNYPLKTLPLRIETLRETQVLSKDFSRSMSLTRQPYASCWSRLVDKANLDKPIDRGYRTCKVVD